MVLEWSGICQIRPPAGVHICSCAPAGSMPQSQPELAKGRQASFFDTWIDQTLMISASKPIQGGMQVFLTTFSCPLASRCADPRKGSQSTLWQLQGHTPHCSVFSGVSSVTQSGISQGNILVLTPGLMLILSPLRELGCRWVKV